MSFTTLIFFSGFLPLTLGAYYLMPKKTRNAVLLIASLCFYAWGDAAHLAVIFIIGVITWLLALALDLPSVREKSIRRFLLTAGVLAAIGPLIWFKKTGALPLGISFFVFQSVAYLVDVYRRDAAALRNPIDFGAFLCFFPKIAQGPITDYRRFSAELHGRQESWELAAYGVRRFFAGFAKKLLIADTLGLVADTVFAQPVGTLSVAIAWGGALAYTFQIFFDFAGYSDMAIGLGALFGFKIDENFDQPYRATSITEFWRRWHMTLGAWFRNYLYIPLGGNRVPKWRNLMNLGIVFLATGIWHGAAWTFILWGVWHGACIIMEKLTGWNKAPTTIGAKVVRHFYLLMTVVLGWVLFRADSIEHAVGFYRAMVGCAGGSPLHSFGFFFPPLVLWTAGIAAVLSVIKTDRKTPDIILALLFVLAYVFLSVGSYQPFVYFKF